MIGDDRVILYTGADNATGDAGDRDGERASLGALEIGTFFL